MLDKLSYNIIYLFDRSTHTFPHLFVPPVPILSLHAPTGISSQVVLAWRRKPAATSQGGRSAACCSRSLLCETWLFWTTLATKTRQLLAACLVVDPLGPIALLNAHGDGLGASLGVFCFNPEFGAAASLWWWHASPRQYFWRLLVPQYVCIRLPVGPVLGAVCSCLRLGDLVMCCQFAWCWAKAHACACACACITHTCMCTHTCMHMHTHLPHQWFLLL